MSRSQVATGLREIAGVRLPDSALCQQALQLATAVSEPVVLNHVLRTYVFGCLLAQRDALRLDHELFFLGAILHDLGLTERFAGTDRFEVVGADAATGFLREHGLVEEHCEVVWDAIALHAQVGIASRKRPEIALVHLGAGVDVLGMGLDILAPRVVAEVIDQLPRLDFKQAFVDILIRTVERSQGAVALTWMQDIACEHIHGFHTPSFTSLLRAAGFES